MKRKISGEKIKSIRRALNMSQTVLARKCYMGQSSIAQYENEYRDIPEHVGELIATALNVKIDDLRG